MPSQVNDNALVDYPTAKSYLGLSNDTWQTVVEDLINSLSTHLEGLLNRVIKQKVGIVEYQDGSGKGYLVLRNTPVTGIQEIVYTEDGEVLASDKYSFYDDGMVVLKYNAVFPKGSRNLKITYTAGYATIPSDLKRVFLFVLKEYFDHYLQGIGAETKGVKRKKSEQIANYRVEYDDDFKDRVWDDPMVKSTLSLYQNMCIA
jgi:hypothetical protein